jgi:ribonuclease BN (tRNA processing enzyme)
MSAANSSGFRLLPLGVGDAFSARYYSSCVAIEVDGAWLLIDCPHPIRKMMREAASAAGTALDIDDISAVALTHLHADHSSGLEGLGFYSRFELGRRMPLLAHPSVAENLWEGHLAAGMQWSRSGPGQPPEERCLADFFELTTLSEGEPTTVGPFSLRCRPTIHSLPTTAFLVEAAGRSLAYSADTTFDPELIEWLSDADLIVHESSGGFMHTSYDRLAELPAKLRAKLRLIHYPDDFDFSPREIQPLRQGHYCQVE